MPSLRISRQNNEQIHFITCTVLHWYYIFDRHDRWQILVDSLNYCTKNKGLKIYGYVLMLNHIHLLVQSPDVSGFLRDFKKHTAFELMKNMKKTEPKLAQLFQDEDGKYHIWQKTNLPVVIESDEVFEQKYQYIERNPVEKKYVEKPEDWLHSSAHLNSPVLISSVYKEE